MGDSNYVAVLPEVPPCSVLSFPSPYDEEKDAYWEVEDLFFVNNVGWWRRGDAGSLWKVDDGWSVVANADFTLAGEMVVGNYLFRLDEVENCA